MVGCRGRTQTCWWNLKVWWQRSVPLPNAFVCSLVLVHTVCLIPTAKMDIGVPKLLSILERSGQIKSQKVYRHRLCWYRNCARCSSEQLWFPADKFLNCCRAVNMALGSTDQCSELSRRMSHNSQVGRFELKKSFCALQRQNSKIIV